MFDLPLAPGALIFLTFLPRLQRAESPTMMIVPPEGSLGAEGKIASSIVQAQRRPAKEHNGMLPF